MAKRAGAALLVTGGALALLLNFKTPEPASATSLGGSVGGTTGSVTGASGGSTASIAATGTTAGSSSGLKSGTYTGTAIQTRYGPVQLQVTISNGRIANISALQYPSDNPRSSSINQYALPTLIQEALQAQSSQVNAVSGATYTSQGFEQSLQSALGQANG